MKRLSIFDVCVRWLAIAVFFIAPLAQARSGSFAAKRALATASHPNGWTTLTKCHYLTNHSNDGGKQYLFRLYFVDTPETDPSLSDRIDEQAKYFGIATEQTIEVGKIAEAFTREKLTPEFTVRTCFQDALGRSKMERFYAIVQTTNGDLAEQLIENGLARIHGASANPVGLPSANVEWQKLEQLESNAKLEKVGGWGVNFGRMLVRSEASKNRVPIDPFDAFFHPECVDARAAMPSASAWPFANPTPIATSTIARSTSTPPPTSGNSKLDINSASEKQLEDVPGIGPTIAGRIIAGRPFKSADDLRNVKGIGDIRYEKIRSYFQ